ncbi:replication endonuclease [Kushneria indalinina]|uniref:Bacteriophage replication gene A protein n=1 Tax=Kushneria indalinina DSM 14324 TaxID=1122140 RepID=A0A3D9DVX0_9GAMM|nr:replication endonuclease [Kushneria indalinina]REC94908.1 bacteriophage replication gene A protein [Kushneria indalinina DSM 14324]
MTSFVELSKAYGAPGKPGPVDKLKLDEMGCVDRRQRLYFDRYPTYAEQLAKAFLVVARKDGNAAGNRLLARLCKRLHVGPFRVTHDDEGICNHAEAQAMAIKRQHDEQVGAANRNGGSELDAAEAALALGLERVEKHEIDPPDGKLPIRVQLARLEDATWWRRKLRVLAGRRLEQLERELGNVHHRAGIYCSNTTVVRRASQKLRNHAMLDAIEAINQHGQNYTLAELSELGLANPDNRRAELMLRIRETEAEARRLGHVGVFYTLTCPSRFHPVRAKSCTRNPNYEHNTPRDGQHYLTGVWARIRAALAREGIGIYGVRVAEPHHDGTPHWHMLMWAHADHVERVNEVMAEYALADTPDEPGAQKNRFQAKFIDYTRGTAAGYVAKYVSKNINGQQFVDLDEYGREMASSAPRVEAWAAVWGIRQFQFVGLPSVTVWREVRRMTEQQAEQLAAWEAATNPGRSIIEFMNKVRTACNAGAWDQFLRLMGGPLTPRKDQPIKPWREWRMDTSREMVADEVPFARGGYGERVEITYGLLVKGAEYLTRFYSWTMRPKARAGAYDFSQKGSYGGGEADDPWTCVNNCTPDMTPRAADPHTDALQAKRYREWINSTEYRAEQELAQQEHEETQFALAEMERRHRESIQPPPAWQKKPEFIPEELR